MIPKNLKLMFYKKLQAWRTLKIIKRNDAKAIEFEREKT